jgi:hypothetical protein
MESDVSQRRFRWALVLAWAPWVPVLFGLGRIFIGIDNAKATGLAAVAGGMAEMLVWWGLAALMIGQVVAVIWLLRSFSKIDMSRNVLSFFSICACGLTLLWLGGFLWITRYVAHR